MIVSRHYSNWTVNTSFKKHHGMFLDFNGDEYILLDNNSNIRSDIGLIGSLGDFTSDVNSFLKVVDDINCSIVVNLELFHLYDTIYDSLHDFHSSIDNPRIITVTNVIHREKTHPNILYNDFLFNFVKGYYLQFQFRPTTIKWYYGSPADYLLPIHTKQKNKIFVAPNRTYKWHPNREITYRPLLVNLLKEKYSDIGYIGNGDDDPECHLVPNSIDINSEEDIALISQRNTRYWPGFPHNHYYETSFISIYAESIETGLSIAATEKTYQPLLKGHFILPFSSSHFIAHLKTIGFRFPDFIDYSYDLIENDNDRFNAYTDELTRLLSITSLEDWQELWNTNYINIIRHNQLVFQHRPYDQINFASLLEKYNT